MRELRGHLDAVVAQGRHGTLPLQCLRTLPQDERTEQAAHQTKEATGECHFSFMISNIHSFILGFSSPFCGPKMSCCSSLSMGHPLCQCKVITTQLKNHGLQEKQKAEIMLYL